MKRPLTVVGLSLLSVMSILCFIDNLWLTVSVSIVSFVLLIITLSIKRCRHAAFLPTVFLSAMAGCLLLLCFSCFSYYPAVKSTEERAIITAKALEYPSFTFEYNRYYCVAEITSVNGEKTSYKARLSLPKSDSWINCDSSSIEPEDMLTFEGTTYIIAKEYPSIHNNYKSRKIFLGAYPTDDVKIEQGKHGVRYFILTVREKAINVLRNNFSDTTSGVLVSVLTGDKSYLDEEIYNNFKHSGVAHIMAVSGLHLSIWILLIVEIIKKRNHDVKKYVPLLMLLVVGIMFFAMFSGSIMRAGFMMLLYLAGFFVRKKSDALNSLGFAVTAVLLINPFMCINIGFLLSVISTFSIIVFALPVTDLIMDKLSGKIVFEPLSDVVSSIVSCIAVSLFAEISTLPVQIAVFAGVPLVGILTNLLFLPVVMPLVLCSGLFCMLNFIPVLSDIVRYISVFLVGYCVKVVESVSKLSYAYIDVSPSWAVFSAICVVILLSAVYLIIKKQKLLLTKKHR